MRSCGGAIVCRLARSVPSLCTPSLVFCVFDAVLRRPSREQKSIIHRFNGISLPTLLFQLQILRLMRIPFTVDKVTASSLQLVLFDSQGACTYDSNNLGVVFPLQFDNRSRSVAMISALLDRISRSYWPSD